MEAEALYKEASIRASKAVTNCYSTSFSLGIKALSKEMHQPIYAIYGFVRLADEIVDTFHKHDKQNLLQEFSKETKDAVERKLSLNPILHSFQWVVNEYDINWELVAAFLKSMELDLKKKTYSREEFKEYIYGSAEVVGLMCLKVFCGSNKDLYGQLKEPAKRLGSAFQKINFLRDLKDDFEDKGRSYFPKINLSSFSDAEKKEIEADILIDFQEGFKGIKNLPGNSKFGVYTAYIYYWALFNKIKKIKAERIIQERIRIPDFNKYLLLSRSYLKFRLGIV